LEGANAAEFAAQIIRLLDDRQLRERIGANGRRYVEANHEWSAIASRLSSVYEEVIETQRRQPATTGQTRYAVKGT
jgi:glycosyltransferase involved in cell wall biosynthesis